MGNYIQQDGIFLEIRSVKRETEPDAREDEKTGTLTVVVDYFVTFRIPGKKSEVCAQAWELVLVPTSNRHDSWRVAEATRIGVC